MCETLGDAEHELRLASRAAEGADVLQLAAERRRQGGCGAPDLDLEFVAQVAMGRRGLAV
jgi:hypothetical protein